MVPELSRMQAAFIQGPVSISLASRDVARRTTIARGLSCRVSEARDQISILVCGARAAALLAELRVDGWMAASYSLPATHETLQVKGRDARVEPAQPGDEALAAAHRAAFATQIAVAGFTVAFTEALLHHEPGQLCWVRFTPAAVYMQTPGPRAGERLKAGG
ncbi:hypothetical protein [Solimonas sp. SE-A11]|uniref:hypothetical protein n=1 Tax=Solimonas sp. SE-A11 TaxID=3054954 RepID=UPI00259D2A45|nr:hypothetical protein [Solimonas sp. SE-A11]MDM4772523.1 hypothetical protein [Solimonas sp. SE-A11]